MIRWAAAILLIGCTTQEAAKVPPCPRAQDRHGLRAASIELLAKIQRPVVRWELHSFDGNFESTGWFESADTMGPLTF